MLTGSLVLLAAAVLSGLGVGSGGIYLLYLTDVLGLAQYTAQGLNLVFFTCSTLAASLLSLLRGRIHLSRLAPILLGGAVGCAVGALLTGLVPAALARRLLGLLLLVLGARTLGRALSSRPTKRAR